MWWSHYNEWIYWVFLQNLMVLHNPEVHMITVVNCRALSSLKSIVVLMPSKFTSIATTKLCARSPATFWRITFTRMTEYILFHILQASWGSLHCGYDEWSLHHVSRQHECWRLVKTDCVCSHEQLIMFYVAHFVTQHLLWKLNTIQWGRLFVNVTCMPWHLNLMLVNKKGFVVQWCSDVLQTLLFTCLVQNFFGRLI